MTRAATILCILASIISGLGYALDAASADLGEPRRIEPVAVPSPWSFTFTTYGWIPWMSGNMAVKGRAFDVNVDPSEIFGHLDWSTFPAWMSYAEARHGSIGLFNDIVYAKLSASKGFAKALPGGDLQTNVSADYTQATIEFGGAYEIWAAHNPVMAGSTALDIIAGGRYWHQNTNISGTLASPPFNGATEKSGSVDWVDPFVGARLRNQIRPGEEFVVRADFGGF